MNKFVLFGAAMLCVAATFSSCKGDEPRLEPVAPPVVYQPNSLRGYVTDNAGNPIANATVTCNQETAKTDNKGYYIFDNVAEGTFKMTAEAANYFAANGEVTIVKSDKTQMAIWNVILDRIKSTTVNVTVAGGGEGEVTSDAIPGNAKANIDITVDVEAGSVPANTNIYVTPIYTEETAKIARAEEDDLLIGATVSSDNANTTFSKPLNLHFDVDATVTESVVTKRLQNGTWVTIPHTVDGNGVNVAVSELGSVGLFFPVNVTKTEGTMGLSMSPKEWDNLFGNADMNVGSSSFTYRAGANYNVHGATTLQALLIERLARLVGPTYKDVNSSYPVNMTLPVGTAAYISGLQRTTAYRVSSKNTAVTGTLYGAVEVTVKTVVKGHHEGGSN